MENSKQCIAICANNSQCSRLKKNGCNYCGTHDKSIKLSITAMSSNSTNKKIEQIEVYVEDINGIVYYLDKNGNVYNTEDVLENRKNPCIIGFYTNNNNKISISFIVNNDKMQIKL